MRLEYMTMFFKRVVFYSICQVYLQRKMYPKKRCSLQPFASAFFTLTALGMPVIVFYQHIHFYTRFLVWFFIYTIYGIFISLQSYKRGRNSSLYALMGNVLIMAIFILAIMQYLKVVTLFPIVLFAAYILFFFLQSLVLSFRFANTLKKAKVAAEQGLKAKSQFLSTMSHEIRTPLNSVIGMSHILLRNNPREDQKENLGVLLFSANNLLELVNDIFGL